MTFLNFHPHLPWDAKDSLYFWTLRCVVAEGSLGGFVMQLWWLGWLFNAVGQMSPILPLHSGILKFPPHSLLGPPATYLTNPLKDPAPQLPPVWFSTYWLCPWISQPSVGPTRPAAISSLGLISNKFCFPLAFGCLWNGIHCAAPQANILW